MNNLTFEEFCNEAAYPSTELPPEAMEKYNKGITRMDFYMESIVVESVKDALSKNLTLTGFTAMQIARDARAMAAEVLSALYEQRIK